MDRLFLETKILATDDGTIEGIAWKYDQPDRIGDIIEKGALTDAAFPIPMLFGHDMNDPIGAWTAGEDREDHYHVTGKALTTDVLRAREVLALVKSGAVRGISLGFVTKKATGRKGGGRVISKLELLEASLVTIPMHPGARVTSAKSAVQALQLAAVINRATAHLSR